MFLEEERRTLAKFAPELDAELKALGLEYLETPECGRLASIIKRHHLPGLLVLPELGGAGCTPHEIIRIHRAIGARAPSMAIMLTMHNFTIAFCNMLTKVMPGAADMLNAVADQQKVVASGFAEGRVGAGILDSEMYIQRDGAGYRLSGSKKPCTMTNCMDYVTVGVAYRDGNGGRSTGMAILLAEEEGISRHPFWNATSLLAADSHELRFKEVYVPSERVLVADDDSQEKKVLIMMGEVMGLCWFEIIVTASYLGVVSGLAERAMSNPSLDVHECALLGSELETAQAALDGAIRIMEQGPFDETLPARILLIRFSIQRTIERCAMHAAELTGGLAFVRDPDIATWLAASRCLAYHPISRKAAEPMMAAYLRGSGA
ncbi:MAG TPA: acyl-CoA dehydrogenase family protein [Terrimicrobiaceae bacterium]